MTEHAAQHAGFSLDSVDFGRYDAEQDKNLLEYFIEIGTAEDVTRGKYLVVGRKGSGKTALFRHLAGTQRRSIIELELEDYVFQAHRALREAGVAEAFAFTTSWRFAIAISMFLSARGEIGFWRRRKGMRILREIGTGPDRGALGAIVDWLGRVRKISLPSISGVAELGSMEIADSPDRVIDARTTQLLTSLEELLREASAKTPITVLIDRLDDAWDGSERSLQLIAGAVRAARHFKALLPQPGTAPVIVFLRTDLWERIAFNDKNKIGQDTIYLDWTEQDLARVIDRRIHTSAGVGEGQGWSTVFTTDEMRQRASAQRYMMKRVLGRPRDIVAFSSLAREAALRSEHSVIEKQDIYDAEVQYSKHILNELRDEIGSHVASMTAVINSLKALGRRTFTVSAWVDVATKNGISAEGAMVVLDHLFEASAVGVLRAGGSKGGSSTVYRYQDRFLKATETGSLQVHLALTKELALTDA